jgi:hypothetical protein
MCLFGCSFFVFSTSFVNSSGGFELPQINEFIKHALSGKRIFTMDAEPVIDQQPPAKSEPEL